MEDAAERLDPELSEEFRYMPGCVSEPAFQVKRAEWYGKIGDVWYNTARVSHMRQDRKKIYPLHAKKKKITLGSLIALKHFKTGLVRLPGEPEKKHCVLPEGTTIYAWLFTGFGKSPLNSG